MKKINDSKYYFYFAIVTLCLAVICGSVSFYSILHVEPAIQELLSADNNNSSTLKKAYLILRNPQIFALYENFDVKGALVKNAIVELDKLVYSGSELKADMKAGLVSLLDRRKKGSRLGRNTAVFLGILSLISWILWFVEKRQAQKSE